MFDSFIKPPTSFVGIQYIYVNNAFSLCNQSISTKIQNKNIYQNQNGNEWNKRVWAHFQLNVQTLEKSGIQLYPNQTNFLNHRRNSNLLCAKHVYMVRRQRQNELVLFSPKSTNHSVIHSVHLLSPRGHCGVYTYTYIHKQIIRYASHALNRT